jgi:hydrogenase-4 component B
MNVLFLLSLIGFGLKAGMMPLHFWLPGAHAAAPSHVSAMLSGVVLKMGIYGLLRFFFLFPDPPSFWGGLVLLMGAVSGLLGVVFAIGQHDLKRLLAYHSVENIGIILMGMGLAMLGRSAGRPEWTVLGLAGCLLHVWNHSLFKSLLFFGAGSVLHGTGTRMIDHLGGLAGSMKWTSALFFIGAMAICGLPPLNGFVSELFVYLGLFRTMTGPGTGGPAAVIAVPVLAMIGALALACFVKVYGTVFLGTPRTFASEGARESPYTMLAPMAVLAAACALIGAAPVLVSPVLEKVIAAWMPAGPGSIPLRLDTLAPLRMVGLMSVLLIGGTAMLMIFSFFLGRPRRRVPTWDCGYARPTGRMQYTASSFARTIVTIFGWVLRPLVHRPHIDTLFPVTAAMNSHVDDAVLDRFLLPAVHGLERRFGWFHRFQQGLTQHYMFYLLVTVVLMLSTLLPFKEIAAFLGLR